MRRAWGEAPFLFVTGMQRSGTTLAARLLAALPGRCVLPQPLPLLFSRAKGEFLAGRDVREAYPLGDLFLERRYAPEEWREFLDSWQPSRGALEHCFRDLAVYSGQYTRFAPSVVERALDRLPGRGFVETVESLLRALDGEGATGLGAKEVSCEEYVPALLAHGWDVLVVVRDPRDVLASLNLGRGREHAGRLKPTLFNLRQWRKSVAHVLAFDGAPGFHWARFEDVLREPRGIHPLASAAALGAWRGNSSFGEREGLDERAVGAGHELPPEVACYVEACCLPELRALGYPAAMAMEEALARVQQFDDPYPLERPELAAYRDPARGEEEAARLRLVLSPTGVDSAAYFLFPRAHGRLATALADDPRTAPGCA